MRALFSVGLLVLIAAAGTVNADVVVGNGLQTTSAAGNSPGSLFRYGTTSMAVISDTQLGGLVPGTQITGIQFRAPNPVGSANLNGITSYANYTISISSFADSPAALAHDSGPSASNPALSSYLISYVQSGGSYNFADYVGSDSQVVRSGPLSLNLNSFDTSAASGAAQAWGPTIMFDTPYIYNGGPLSILYRMSDNGLTTSGLLDAIRTDNHSLPNANYGADIIELARAGSSSVSQENAANGALGAFIVTNFITSSVPAPSVSAILGLGALTAIRRKR